MPPQDILKARQAAAKIAYDKMIARLIDYSPCHKLSVEDILYLARTVQTLAFEATEQAA